MKIEFLKLIKNIPIISILFFWIIIAVSSLPRPQGQFMFLKVYAFNGVINNANPLVFIFNSANAFLTAIIIPIICHLAFIKDLGIYNNARVHFFKKTLFIITFFKVLAISSILSFIYMLIFLIYSIVTYFRFDISLFQSIDLIIFFLLKFILISTLFSYFLLLFQSLISWRRSLVYYSFYLLGIISILFYGERSFTPYNWYINGLGYYNRLTTNKSFRVEHDFNSELLLTSLVCVFCLIFYFLYERRKAIY